MNKSYNFGGVFDPDVMLDNFPFKWLSKEELDKKQEELNDSDHDEREFLGMFIPSTLYIKKVLYNDPATIVFWSDGTKTISKCHGFDTYSPECGLAICVIKKLCGSSTVRNMYEDWLPYDHTFYPDDSAVEVTIKDVRNNHK